MSAENGAAQPGENTGESPARLPAKTPDAKLTIQQSRLAGSIECMNCGTALQGPFCHYCGQPDKNLMRFFPALLREMLEDFIDFDSRFMRTMKPLLFKPGKLTRDYLDGRRFRYVPPMRLYIFASLALFFLFAVLADDAITFDSKLASDEPGITVNMDEGDAEDLREALSGLEEVQPGLAEEIAQNIEQAAAEQEEEQDSHEPGEISFDVDGKPWDPETNPVVIPLMPDWVNRWINKEIEESPQKGQAIEDNPNLILDKILDVLPGTMFVLLPLVALLLKFWYLFAKKYYVEHLIFALHNHAFIFVVLLLMVLMSVVAGWREPDGGPVTSAVEWVKIVLMIWVPVYLLISMKRVYQQGWGLTVAKYTAVGITYLVLLGFVTVFVAALSFVLL